MKTLIIHHLEPIWWNAYNSFGTSFGKEQDKILKFLKKHRCKFNEVILTRFEIPSKTHLADDYDSELSRYISRVEEYDYGWDESMFSSQDQYCEGGNHSKVVYLADWIRKLEGQIYICGAFNGECIEDLEIALRFLKKKFKRIEKLIVG